jgi:sugar lactone lactonase YvrE
MFAGAASLMNGAEATLVLGQADFTSRDSGAGAAQMANPSNVFVDASDNLWVCDQSNHRILKFASVSTLSNGAAASVVIGQAGFGMGGSSTGANRLYYPADVLVDGEDHLWIADPSNHRVLRFDGAASLVSGASAAVVFGQVNFTSNSLGTTATTMRLPSSLAMQSDGSLWVADQLSHRVLYFLDAASKGNGAAADGVVGQPDLSTGTAGLSARRLNGPTYGIAFDLEGRLWVPDTQNNRVLRFPTVPSPPADLLPPNLILRSKVPRVTTKSTIRISGSASDDNGVAAVQYRVGGRAFSRATGTTSWSFRAKLKVGKNRIQLFATDGAGNASPRKTLTVERK